MERIGFEPTTSWSDYQVNSFIPPEGGMRMLAEMGRTVRPAEGAPPVIS